MSLPALSVILVSLDNYEVIEWTVEHLALQSTRGQFQLIVCLVDPEGSEDLNRHGFHSVHIVKIERLLHRAEGMVAALPFVDAPAVAFLEDHSFPCPGWGEGLIAGHAENHVAVGPAVLNANPNSVISWADILTGYGTVLAGGKRGKRPALAGHNCTYKTAALRLYEPQVLSQLLDCEVVLHEQMMRDGLQLKLIEDVHVRHLNFERLKGWLPAQFWHGRLHAGVRAESLPWYRRLIYATGSPLIPFIRTRRILQQQPPKCCVNFVQLSFAVFLGQIWGAAGEACGALMGVGEAAERLMPLEFRRERFFRNGKMLRQAVPLE